MTEDFKVRGIEASEIVSEIKDAIANASLDQRAGQGNLELHSIEIKMTTVAEIVTAVKPKFKVPFVDWEVGASYEYGKTDTHEVVVVLQTPWARDDEPEVDDRKLQGVKIADALASVVGALRSMLEEAAAGSLSLHMKRTTALFRFEVNKEGNLALAVPSVDKKWGSTIEVKFVFG